MDAIDRLRQQNAQDAEAVRAHGVMIEVLSEAVERLTLAGFAPVLDMPEAGSLVVLRLDPRAWAVRAVARVVAAEPLPAVKESLTVAPATVPDAPMVPVAVPQPACAPAPKVPCFPPRFWTAEREALILRLRPTMTARDIAAEVGVTEKAVQVRFNRLKARGIALPEAFQSPNMRSGVPSVRRDGAVLRAWTDADDAALVAAYGGEQTVAQIAAALDRSPSAVTKRLTHLREKGQISHHRGFVPLENIWPEAQLQQLRDLWPVTSTGEIAARFGLSKGAISGMAHRLGLGPAFRGRRSDAAKPVGAAVPVAEVTPDVAPSVPDVAPLPVEQKSEPVLPPETASEFAAKSGGNFVPAMARPALAVRAPSRVMTGMTRSEREAVIAQHVDGLPDHAEFDAELDLELCEAIFGGKGGIVIFATDMGIDQRVALARFDVIVAPLRSPGIKHLPIDAAGLILPALRARVKAARGVAA
ncbi:MAG: hypothetical protein ACK4MS_10585 [Paracoccaceae bacterium]